MKWRFLAIAAAGGLAGCAATESPEVSAAPDRRLIAELDGYEPAGPAVNCVRMPDLQGNRSVGRDAIVFSGSGNRKWLNRTRGSCPSLEFGRALRLRTTSTQLCSGEIASVFDPSTGVEYGSCALGDFTPYRRRPG